MTDKDAMKLALFALDIVKIHYTQSRHVNEAITALKERLAQPEQEADELTIAYMSGLYDGKKAQRTEQEPVQEPVAEIVCDALGCLTTRWNDEWIPNEGDKLYSIPPQRTEQEPDYWLGYGLQAHTEKPFEYATALYRHPLQRKPLTDEQIQKIWDVASGTLPGWSRHIAYARAIEAAHGIKEKT